MRHWTMVLIALLPIMGCDALISRNLFVGDSIFTTSAGTIVQEGYRRGHHVAFNVHGATPVGSNGVFSDWTSEFWVPRALALKGGGVEWDCAVVSLGTNDTEPPATEDVLAIDEAYLEPFWLLPRVDYASASRAVIESVIPEERRISLEYELSDDGVHPSPAGAAQIATRTIDACEQKAIEDMLQVLDLPATELTPR